MCLRRGWSTPGCCTSRCDPLLPTPGSSQSSTPEDPTATACSTT